MEYAPKIAGLPSLTSQKRSQSSNALFVCELRKRSLAESENLRKVHETAIMIDGNDLLRREFVEKLLCLDAV